MKPLVQIVDQADNLIGHKPRAAVDPQHDIYRSSCIWIENNQGAVLIAQRKWDRDKDPGMWGTAAAGTVEQDETYESNAYKEATEEIGLKGISLQPVAKIWEGTPRQHHIQVFKGICDWPIERFTIQQEEVEQIAWVPKQQLIEDLQANPGKYVPSMAQLLKLFSA